MGWKGSSASSEIVAEQPARLGELLRQRLDASVEWVRSGGSAELFCTDLRIRTTTTDTHPDYLEWEDTYGGGEPMMVVTPPSDDEIDPATLESCGRGSTEWWTAVFGFCYDASAVKDAVGGDEDILRMLEAIRTCESVEYWCDAAPFREDVELALADRVGRPDRLDGVRVWCKETMRELDLEDSDEEDEDGDDEVGDDEDGEDSDGAKQRQEHALLQSALALEIRRLESKLLY